jgi:hypothetical protein
MMSETFSLSQISLFISKTSRIALYNGGSQSHRTNATCFWSAHRQDVASAAVNSNLLKWHKQKLLQAANLTSLHNLLRNLLPRHLNLVTRLIFL